VGRAKAGLKTQRAAGVNGDAGAGNRRVEKRRAGGLLDGL
jgi:hypothetical protein